MFITSILLSALISVNSPVCNSFVADTNPSLVLTEGVVFRRTQRLRASDGREIYFYSNGTFEIYYRDNLKLKGKYTLFDNGEFRLQDEDGTTRYKGTVRYKQNRIDLSSITLSGTTFLAF